MQTFMCWKHKTICIYIIPHHEIHRDMRELKFFLMKDKDLPIVYTW